MFAQIPTSELWVALLALAAFVGGIIWFILRHLKSQAQESDRQHERQLDLQERYLSAQVDINKNVHELQLSMNEGQMRQQNTLQNLDNNVNRLCDKLERHTDSNEKMREKVSDMIDIINEERKNGHSR